MDNRAPGPAIDPEPLPPTEPGLSDCCTSGCSPCIFDLYQDALERYQADHAAWLARQGRTAGVAAAAADGAPSAAAPGPT